MLQRKPLRHLYGVSMGWCIHIVPCAVHGALARETYSNEKPREMWTRSLWWRLANCVAFSVQHTPSQSQPLPPQGEITAKLGPALGGFSPKHIVCLKLWQI